MNLVQRDINIDSVLCPVCVTNDEDAHNLFFRYDLAQYVLRRLCHWWDLDTYGWSSFHDWLSWFSTIRGELIVFSNLGKENYSMKVVDNAEAPRFGCDENLRRRSHATRGDSKGVNLTKKLSNSNPFDVLNSAENGEELGTNDGTLYLVSNGTHSSSSLFWNIETSNASTIPIVDKIGKLEMLIINGKVTLMNDDVGKPLKRLIIRVIMIG
nr:RNA-directed DNA polymerase, eukaryota [Tanacetum cinerariifolium]